MGGLNDEGEVRASYAAEGGLAHGFLDVKELREAVQYWKDKKWSSFAVLSSWCMAGINERTFAWLRGGPLSAKKTEPRLVRLISLAKKHGSVADTNAISHIEDYLSTLFLYKDLPDLKGKEWQGLFNLILWILQDPLVNLRTDRTNNISFERSIYQKNAECLLNLSSEEMEFLRTIHIPI